MTKRGWGTHQVINIRVELLFNGDVMTYIPVTSLEEYDQFEEELAKEDPALLTGAKDLAKMLDEITEVCKKHGKTLLW